MDLWPDLSPLRTQSWDAVCVDIPIGLKNGAERRVCDEEARKQLGRRRSSVFFAPPRELLQATEYDQVRTHGMSLQTFYLLPKIREMDRVVTPERQSIVVEAHPELAFQARAGRELAKKKTPEGLKERKNILEAVGSPFLLHSWEGKFLRKNVARDDLLDAAILLEVARQRASGNGRSVGGRELDSRGLKMEICF